jgi:membrane protein implicated in regulation of membrane protease activity
MVAVTTIVAATFGITVMVFNGFPVAVGAAGALSAAVVSAAYFVRARRRDKELTDRAEADALERRGR